MYMYMHVHNSLSLSLSLACSLSLSPPLLSLTLSYPLYGFIVGLRVQVFNYHIQAYITFLRTTYLRYLMKGTAYDLISLQAY